MSTKDQISQYDENAQKWASVVHAEKRHLAPQVAIAFARLPVNPGGRSGTLRSVDFGANDGVMAMMAVKAIEHELDINVRPALYDLSEKSLDEARKNFGYREFLITSDYDVLRKDNDLVVATHVVQSFGTEESLREKYFRANLNLLAPGGYFISTGNHPETLTELHSAYQSRFPGGVIADGEEIKTDLYSADAEKPFLTVSDYYWSLGTLQRAAKAAGFVIHNERDIPDLDVPFERGHDPAYLMMVLQRPERDI